MAVKETKILGINDLRLCRIVQDDSAGFKLKKVSGGSARDVIDLPGVQTLSLTPTFVEKELRGDEVVLDKYTKLDSINWSFTNAIMSLDALSALLGGAVSTSGSNQVFTLTGLDLPYYFVLEGQAEYTSEAGGDIHVRLFKAKANKVDYELKGEDYCVVSVSGMAIPTSYVWSGENGGRVKTVTINDTITAINFSDLDVEV